MAIPQQGAYLATMLAGFTALAAGLAGLGIVVTVVGFVLLIYSAVSFHRIKSLESGK